MKELLVTLTLTGLDASRVEEGVIRDVTLKVQQEITSRVQAVIDNVVWGTRSCPPWPKLSAAPSSRRIASPHAGGEAETRGRRGGHFEWEPLPLVMTIV